MHTQKRFWLERNKFLAMALFGALSLSFSACGGSSKDDDTDDDAGIVELDAGPVVDPDAGGQDAGEQDAGTEIDPTKPSAASEAALEKMLPVIEYLVQNQYTDGTVVAAVTPDGMSVRGLGSLADSAAPELETFDIASITKVFVGMALASMTKDGIVSPDTKLTECMPDGYDTDGIEDITLGMLATHSAGYGHDQSNIYELAAENAGGEENIVDSDLFSYISVDDIWSSLTVTPRTRVGQDQYSNYGVAVLGNALAVCDHEASWKDVIRKRVTSVLGLDSTGIDIPLTTRGYDGSLQYLAPWTWMLDGLGPCGSFKSNAADLGRLARLILSKDNYPGSDMVNLAVTPLKRFDDYSAYGYNWMIGPEGAETSLKDKEVKELLKTVIWHGGGSDTYATFVGVSREKDFAFIMLNNSRALASTYGGIFSMALQMGETEEVVIDDALADGLAPALFELTEAQAKKFEGT